MNYNEIRDDFIKMLDDKDTTNLFYYCYLLLHSGKLTKEQHNFLISFELCLLHHCKILNRETFKEQFLINAPSISQYEIDNCFSFTIDDLIKFTLVCFVNSDYDYKSLDFLKSLSISSIDIVPSEELEEYLDRCRQSAHEYFVENKNKNINVEPSSVF